MKTKIKTLTFLSLIVGIGTMFLFRWLSGNGASAEPYDYLWEKLFVSTLIIFSFICGLLEPAAPWRWPVITAYIHYFSGFFIMKFWGQIPPFELIYIGILCIPAVAIGYLASWIGKKVRSFKRAAKY